MAGVITASEPAWHELPLEVRKPARLMLIGGEGRGLPRAHLVRCNFVGRDRAESDVARASLARRDDRFGRVDTSLPYTPASAPF
ncbi:hypothetical protein G3I31_05190 [Streptomyces sp. SID9913]|uniref:Uncharacterized protein n=2 Tax=unclassified Streptomyces TaxID=2593676 RepID=A0A6G3R0G2_9ACTN|nr:MULTISPECIES: hypothetical protein [unclassified Streptomyces]NEA89229.1 hypothetical protein [Streptomyces sp. SID14436]NEC82568.1 hypothetical protein [Streptomyces sp. SID7958]NED17562.1 hypothetical protein [Streptomyces sp. SID9913]